EPALRRAGQAGREIIVRGLVRVSRFVGPGTGTKQVGKGTDGRIGLRRFVPAFGRSGDAQCGVQEHDHRFTARGEDGTSHRAWASNCPMRCHKGGSRACRVAPLAPDTQSTAVILSLYWAV